MMTNEFVTVVTLCAGSQLQQCFHNINHYLEMRELYKYKASRIIELYYHIQYQLSFSNISVEIWTYLPGESNLHLNIYPTVSIVI